jgi:hypothetical protein
MAIMLCILIGGTEPITQTVIAYRRVVNSTSCSYSFQEIGRFDEQFNDRAPNDIVFLYTNKGGNMVYVSDTNIAGQGGVHMLKINSDETAISYIKWISLPLASIMRVLSSPKADRPYLAILGGYKPADITIVDASSSSSLSIVANLTIWTGGGMGQAQSLSVDPTSRWLLVPDSSPFDNNLLSSIEVVWPSSPSQPPSMRVASQVAITETTGVAFSVHSTDIITSRFSQNRVTYLAMDISTGNLTIGDDILHVGLADRTVFVNGGNEETRGLILVSSVTDIVVMKFKTKGTGGLDRIATYSFPDAIEWLVGDVSVQGNDFTF